MSVLEHANTLTQFIQNSTCPTSFYKNNQLANFLSLKKYVITIMKLDIRALYRYSTCNKEIHAQNGDMDAPKLLFRKLNASKDINCCYVDL